MPPDRPTPPGQRIIVAGHVCVDLIPTLPGSESLEPGSLAEIGPLEIRPGGCVANTGRVLAELGRDVSLMADIGDDSLGALLAEALATWRVDAAGVRRVDGGATSYSLILDHPGGDRVVWHHTGANAGFDGSRIDASGSCLLHLGYPSLLPAMHADGGSALLETLERASGAGLTTSLNLAVVDPDSPAGRVAWPEVLGSVLPVTDVISASAADLASAGVAGSAEPAHMDELAAGLVRDGAAVALVTAGSAGACLRTAGSSRLRRAGRCLADHADEWADVELFATPPALTPVRTVGAGDAATAGLLSALVADRCPPDWLRAAVAAAATVVSGTDVGEDAVDLGAAPA
jgi:sugar/nucleoside kinase (ribokinase family)